MDPNAPRRPTILVMHPDPLVRTGLVAALRQQESLRTLDDTVDASAPGESGIDVVVTDYGHALRLAGYVLLVLCLLSVARLLVRRPMIARRTSDARSRRASTATSCSAAPWTT